MSAASAAHTESVAAPFALVRALLEEKVYHPEKSIAAASNVRIVRDGGAAEGVERKMFLSTKGPSGGDVHELITWRVEEEAAGGGAPRRMLVTFATLEDALTRGSVTNLCVEDPATGGVVLTYEMKWDWRDDTPAERRAKPLFEDAGAMMRGAVRGMKALCERRALEAAATA